MGALVLHSAVKQGRQADGSGNRSRRRCEVMHLYPTNIQTIEAQAMRRAVIVQNIIVPITAVSRLPLEHSVVRLEVVQHTSSDVGRLQLSVEGLALTDTLPTVPSPVAHRYSGTA